MSFFSFAFGRPDSDSGIPEIFSFPLSIIRFVKVDVISTYSKILTDVVERTHGLSEEQMRAMWDSCVHTEAQLGLISLLSESMFEMGELVLVYKERVLRKATSEESIQIKTEYRERGESRVGVFISFNSYMRTERLKTYSEMEYSILAALYKSMNVAKATQIKMKKLRESVSLKDSGVAIAQAKSMANALRAGNDIVLDADDIIESATPNTDPAEKSIGFLDQKRAFILGLPMAYVVGLQSSGIASTGEADTKAIERGLKQFFMSIIQPVCKALFNVPVTFKSQDFREVNSLMEALKTFELIGEDLITIDQKREYVCRMMGVQVEAKGPAEGNTPEPEPDQNDRVNTNVNQAPPTGPVRRVAAVPK